MSLDSNLQSAFTAVGTARITKRHANKLTKMFLVFFTLIFLLIIWFFHFVMLLISLFPSTPFPL